MMSVVTCVHSWDFIIVETNQDLEFIVVYYLYVTVKFRSEKGKKPGGFS